MTSETAPRLDDIDLRDSEMWVQGRAHDVFRVVRREQPVRWSEPLVIEGQYIFPGFWSITKYDDIVTISRDPATFISGKGFTMGSDPENPHPAEGIGKLLLATDPPRHVRLRRLINKGFTPRAVAAFEPHVRGFVGGIIDEIAERGGCDFVTDVAAQLPLAVICEMMGVPRQDWQLMFDLTNKVLGGDDPEYQSEGADTDRTINEGHIRMFGYFMGMLGERRAQRREDLVSVLVDAEIDGDKLTDEEILYFCFLLIVAGNETTRNAISGGMLAFSQHPEQWREIVADPALLPVATEEILRWTSPVSHMARFASRDVTIRGQPIKAGEKVVLWYPSANRDEEIYPDGDIFTIRRTPNDHLAFGIGEHFCLGAGFARLEIRVMFEELARRLPDIHQSGPAERLRSTFIGGIKHLPVEFTPAEREVVGSRQ
jgi:cytochrome P450